MTQVKADITAGGLLMNGRSFHDPVRTSEFTEVLQSPARVLVRPTMYGLANRIHIFDDLGLYLVEHYTGRVGYIVFLFRPEDADFPPPPGSRPEKSTAFQSVQPFSGELTVAGVRFFAGMTTEEYVNGTIFFGKPVARIWNFWSGGIYISLTSKGQLLPTGGRGRRRYFVDVCVGFISPGRVVEKFRELGALGSRSDVATRPLAERTIYYVHTTRSAIDKGLASLYKETLSPPELAALVDGLIHIGEEELAGEFRGGFELLKEDGFYEHMNWKKVSASVKAEVDIIGERIGNRLWFLDDKLAAFLDEGGARRTNG